MKKKNILVFPCGSEIALEIYSAVQYSRYFHLIGGSSVSDHGEFVYDDYIEGIPFINDENFIPAIKSIVAERHIDALYPAMDTVITVLKENESEIGCKIIAPDVRTTQICLSKKKTYEKLDGIVRIPHVYNSIEEVNGFPVFLKPEIGYGAKGTQTVYTYDELVTALSENPNRMIMEYLPGHEYTIDCFTDRQGKLLYSRARLRNRIRTGISVNTSFVENQNVFTNFCKKINAAIKFRGAWFVQVKEDKDGNLCLMEIAARLGGSSALSRAIGMNFALMSLFDAFDYDVNILINNYSPVMDRALDEKFKLGISYQTVYVDYDDCVILNNEVVNTELIAFLYQCRNKGIKVIVLSKHEGNLDDDLNRFRIREIFDEVIHIGSNVEKTEFIEEKNAIFIDDSFNERKKVANKFGLYTFSPDMIECLMD